MLSARHLLLTLIHHAQASRSTALEFDHPHEIAQRIANRRRHAKPRAFPRNGTVDRLDLGAPAMLAVLLHGCLVMGMFAQGRMHG